MNLIVIEACLVTCCLGLLVVIRRLFSLFIISMMTFDCFEISGQMYRMIASALSDGARPKMKNHDIA